jgi:Tol biopolymer transport system component
MTDERVDALIRRLDITSSPDPAFTSSSMATLRPWVRAARVQDMSRVGRLRRDLRLALAPTLRSPIPRPIAIVGLAILLLLAALAAAIVIAGAFNRSVPFGNGPLVVAAGGEIRAIDVDIGSVLPIVPAGENAKHVSRSPDGQIVAYWKVDPAGDQLMLIGIDGQGRRPVAQGRAMTWAGCVDTWSPDSRYVASEVRVDGASRILVADSLTGTGRLVTPDGVIGHCPLWSPDSESIAFAQEPISGPSVLAIIRADGTGLHSVNGDIGGADVAGANSWSNDGWIYFTTRGAHGSIWRANVALATSTKLTNRAGFATAVAASPDGMLISWIVDVPTGWDLYVSDSDGTDPRLLLADALSCGWSADGRYILARWTPRDGAGGLAVVSPDGTEVRLVVPADQGGLDPDQVCDIGWGQSRP